MSAAQKLVEFKHELGDFVYVRLEGDAVRYGQVLRRLYRGASLNGHEAEQISYVVAFKDKDSNIFPDARVFADAREAFGEPGHTAVPYDPCPGCKPGAVCRTPNCGRLKARNSAANLG